MNKAQENRESDFKHNVGQVLNYKDIYIVNELKSAYERAGFLNKATNENITHALIKQGLFFPKFKRALNQEEQIWKKD